jgi:hypothetical protein
VEDVGNNLAANGKCPLSVFVAVEEMGLFIARCDGAQSIFMYGGNRGRGRGLMENGKRWVKMEVCTPYLPNSRAMRRRASDECEGDANEAAYSSG